MLILLIGGIVLVTKNEAAQCEKFEQTQEATKAIANVVSIPADEVIEIEVEAEAETKEEAKEEAVTLEAPIAVDFNELPEDVEAWLYIPDIDISYPIMSSGIDYYYLSHDINGNKDACGSICMDYRSVIGSSKLMVYGHNLSKGRGFGKLKSWENPMDKEVWVIAKNGDAFKYCVDEIKTVDTAKDSSDYVINEESNPDELILATCAGLHDSTRLLVVCHK